MTNYRSVNAHGERLPAEAYERTVTALAHHLDGWSDDDVGRLSELLARLRTSFGDCRAGDCRSPDPDGARPRSAAQR